MSVFNQLSKITQTLCANANIKHVASSARDAVWALCKSRGDRPHLTTVMRVNVSCRPINFFITFFESSSLFFVHSICLWTCQKLAGGGGMGEGHNFFSS